MAVRVRIRIRGPKGKSVETVAVLNGGFEVPMPHLLLPARCAEQLFGNFRPNASQQEMQAAGARVLFYVVPGKVQVRVLAPGSEGVETAFRVLVSETDDEVLISDTGIDALGVHIESFAPGRWRLSDEHAVRDSEGSQRWPTGRKSKRRKRKRS